MQPFCEEMMKEIPNEQTSQTIKIQSDSAVLCGCLVEPPQSHLKLTASNLDLIA